MKNWPKNAVRTLAVMSFCWVASLYFVWSTTNDNYLAVGKNNGSIEERYKLIERLKSIAPVDKCTDWPDSTNTAVLVAVKTEQVNARVGSDGQVKFCAY